LALPQREFSEWTAEWKMTCSSQRGVLEWNIWRWVCKCGWIVREMIKDKETVK
jgi:hypothetical protein